MSKAKLEAFLQRPRPCIDHLSHTPILLSDSKGFLLQREDTDNKIIYWCESGATAATLVKTLENRILDANFQYGKIVFYIWGGTCDLTTKNGRFIKLRSQSNHIIEDICEQYKRAINIVHRYGHIIKFIGVPNYSIQLYNNFKGHREVSSFKNDDRILDEQVKLLNTRLENLSVSQNTVKVHTDIVKRRKDPTRTPPVRYSYNFSQLYDGLHANKLLSKVWLRKVYIDISTSCVDIEDIVQIHVPQGELDDLD